MMDKLRYEVPKDHWVFVVSFCLVWLQHILILKTDWMALFPQDEFTAVVSNEAAGLK
jgi:hypothetical protein